MSAPKEPVFGEWIRGIYASERNPLRDGMYVETIRRRGKMNPGKFYRLTDGRGEFWEYPANSTVRRPAPADATEAANEKLGAIVGVNYYPGVECEHGYDFCPVCDPDSDRGMVPPGETKT